MKFQSYGLSIKNLNALNVGSCALEKNTAHVHFISVPLLLEIPRAAPEYMGADRILKPWGLSDPLLLICRDPLWNLRVQVSNNIQRL